MGDFETVEVEPELGPLFDALLDCGIRSHRVIAQTMERLSTPPEAFYQPPQSTSKLANAVLKAMVPFDGDMAVGMLPLKHQDSAAKWKTSSRDKRKRAKRQWNWMLNIGLGGSQKGRPAKLDGALVV